MFSLLHVIAPPSASMFNAVMANDVVVKLLKCVCCAQRIPLSVVEKRGESWCFMCCNQGRLIYLLLWSMRDKVIRGRWTDAS